MPLDNEQTKCNIKLIHEILTKTTTPGQSGLDSNGKIGSSPSDAV